MTFSHTRLDAFRRCPRRFWYRYIAKEQERVVPQLLNGQQMHEAIRQYGQHCYARGISEDEKQAALIAGDVIEEAKKQAEFLWWARDHSWPFRTPEEREQVYGVTESLFEVVLEADLPDDLGRFVGHLDFVRVLPGELSEKQKRIYYTDWKGGWQRGECPPSPPPQLQRYAWLISQTIAGPIEAIDVEIQHTGSGTVLPGIDAGNPHVKWWYTPDEAKRLGEFVVRDVREVLAAIDGYEQDKTDAGLNRHFPCLAGEQCSGCTFGHVCSAAKLFELYAVWGKRKFPVAGMDIPTLRQVECWHKAQAALCQEECQERWGDDGFLEAKDGALGGYHENREKVTCTNFAALVEDVLLGNVKLEKVFNLKQTDYVRGLVEKAPFAQHLKLVPGGRKWAWKTSALELGGDDDA